LKGINKHKWGEYHPVGFGTSKIVLLCDALHVYLVGGLSTPLKNMKVSWDDDIPNICKNKTSSKPPTSYGSF